MSQVSFLAVDGSLRGRQTTVPSSGGRLPSQNAFLASSCLRVRLFLDCHADKETEGFGAEHGHITLWFGLYSIFMIA